MKIKILLTLAVSLFCIDALSRTRANTNKIRYNNNVNTGASSAFKEQIPLKPVEGCRGDCFASARESLNHDGVRVTNQIPDAERGPFLSNLGKIYGVLTTYYSPQSSRSLDIDKIRSGVTGAKKEAKEAITALASATQISADWPESAKQNLTEFKNGLADGVNPQEAEMLRQVQENCVVL